MSGGLGLDGASSPRLALAQNGMNATRPAICYRTTIYINQPSNDMKFSKLLPLPKGHRRSRSKARSEIGSIEGQGEPDPVTPRPMESTPDLRVGASTSSMSSPLTPRDQESNGMQTTFFRTIYLTTFFAQHRPLLFF